MRVLRAPFLAFCLMVLPRLHAVYAPIPEIEQGKALTAYLSAGAYYDSNIFGRSADEIGSYVYTVDPSLVFNASLDAKTFASASYRLSYDYMPDRPGKKSLDSHELKARIAHTFTPQTELDISDTYQISKNPESLLPGLATVVNTDQSYRLNQFDARFSTGLTKRTGLIFKGRDTRYNFQNEGLSRSLDRVEYLAGIAANHTLLPELQAVAEFRHLVINYNLDGATKNKRSDFALIGADHVLNARVSLSGRLGLEKRRRSGDRDATLPYVELGCKFDYSKGSYLAVGYGHSIEEVSNIELYTDMSVNRFFLNLQHAITGKLIATSSLNWEPSQLHGRRGVRADQNETNTRAGFALIYKPAKTWSVSLSFDYDKIESDDVSRKLLRQRTGLSARYVF
ncbi:MAG: hypothetical protein IPP19_01255 [Verrucomicrobia bacterium]|nr:hypothetical protein [Verrucomicrobiota bacterium]